MSKDNDDMGELGPAEKVVDMGDLNGNPIPAEPKAPAPAPKVSEDELSLTNEEEELLKKKLERIRKSDPFIYR